jgi:putative membrane protein
MVAWMAGMFYLPRLFVYHCDMTRGSPESERFKVMEFRLLKQIINPAVHGRPQHEVAPVLPLCQ